MDSQNPAHGYVDKKVLEDGLTDDEKSLRDLFIDYYLQSYDPVRAAISCGFLANLAGDFGHGFLKEGYVRRRISELEQEVSKDRDAIDSNRIRAMLFEQATYYGPGNSHGARVAALGKLASLININDLDIATDVRNLRIEFA